MESETHSAILRGNRRKTIEKSGRELLAGVQPYRREERSGWKVKRVGG